MRFHSKTEAYSYTILVLTRIRDKFKKNTTLEGSESPQLTAIESALNAAKIAMENHEQNPNVVIGILDTLKPHIDGPLSRTLTKLQEDIRHSTYAQTPAQKHQNPLARRAESELAIALLRKPTPAMMESVRRVSEEILKLIDSSPRSVQVALNLYFAEHSHVIAFGASSSPPSIADVKALLRRNDPARFIEIMHIHFKFAQAVTRDVSIRHAPARKPVGKLAEIVAEIYPGRPAEEFFRVGLAEDRSCRAYISDVKMYKSPLYTAIAGRGRAGEFSGTRTRQMGLMMWGQEEHEVGLPIHFSRWAADCKSQPANLNSPYVTDLIDNDAVYVAGPSGMTSMFLGQMEILANFENEDLKKNYLSAVVSYIVGGGFHSLHEVIGPAQDALNLVPGYLVQTPQFGVKAPPPNYHQFFAQQAAIDPDFEKRREDAWTRYLAYFREHYAPKYIREFAIEEQHLQQNLKASMFHQALKNLEDKVQQLEVKAKKKPHYQNASLAARALHNRLSELGTEYLSKPLTPERKREFSEACSTAIRDASVVLKEHRGWTKFLHDLAFVVTAVITLGAALGVSLLATGDARFFKPPKTKSLETVEKVQESVDNVPTEVVINPLFSHSDKS